MRLLVIEDERPLAETLARGLKREGYAVDIAHNAERALELRGCNTYDAVVLDLNLPDMDGIRLLTHLRSECPSVLVLILTARTGLDDRVRGLDAGADDYLIKPFQFAELCARVRALLRREPRALSPLLHARDLTLDPATRKVWRGRTPIELTRRESGILEYLMRRVGELVSQEELLEQVWGDEADPFTAVVRVHIASLRRKLGDDARNPRYIYTKPGGGYWITGAVS